MIEELPFAFSDSTPSLIANLDAWQRVKSSTAADRVVFLNALVKYGTRNPIEVCNEMFSRGYGGMVQATSLVEYIKSAHNGSFSAQWALARTISEPTIKEAVTLEIIRNASKTDPLLALDIVSKSGSDALERHKLRRQILGEIVKTANTESVTEIGMSPLGTNRILKELINVWIEKDPAKALAYLNSKQGLRFNKAEHMPSIFRMLPPEIALNVAKDMPASSFRDDFLNEQVVKQLAHHPEKWDALVSSATSQALTARLAEQAAIQSVIQNPLAATRFLDKISSDRTRRWASREVTAMLLNQKGTPENNRQSVAKWADTVTDSVVLSGIVDNFKKFNLPLPDSLKQRKDLP